MKTNTDTSVAEPTAGSLSPAASVVDRHPLYSVNLHHHMWETWKERWDGPDLSGPDRVEMLHHGFQANTGGDPRSHERVQLYLALATNHQDREQFKEEASGGGLRFNREELRWKVSIATKAFQMLCTQVLKGELVTYKFYYEQDWLWSWLFDDEVTVEYLTRFLLAEGKCANKEEHPYDILNKFIRAIGTVLFESSDTVTYICTEEAEKARRLSHVELMRPRLLPIFLDRGNAMYLCGKGASVMLENPGCMKVMRQYIFSQDYYLPEEDHPLEHPDCWRKAKSLQEAVVGGSEPAIAYGILLVKKKYQAKLARRRKAQADIQDAQRRL